MRNRGEETKEKIVKDEKNLNNEINTKVDNKKEENVLNKLFNSLWFPVLIGIILLIKTILFYQWTISNHEELDRYTIFGTIAFISILMCLVSVLPNRGRIISALIIDLLVSLVLFADNVYYTYSSSVISVAQIMNLQYGEEILNTLPMLVQLKEIVYVVDIILVIIALIAKIIKIEKKEKMQNKYKVARIIVGVFSIALFTKASVYYVNKSQEDPFNKDMQVKKGTIFGYHLADVESAINIKKSAKYETAEEMEEDYDELKDEYEEFYGETIYDLEGIAEGKNVIIIQLESIQEFVVNKMINGTEITPNLNKFLNENIEFSNMFMQSYSSTADSEFSVSTSLYPMENGMSYSRYYTNAYDTIFGMVEKLGYTTSFMHGNQGFFWNRESVYKRFGVDNIELIDSFEDTSEMIMGYLSDELLYTQAVDKLKTYEEPYMSFIVSASSHTSFSLEGLEDRSKVNLDVGKYEGTYFGNYLQAVNYADYAFGVFIDKLKEEGIYDDAVIIVFGDHNGIDMYNEDLIDFLQETDDNLTDTDLKLNYIRVLCGMKIPGVKGVEIEKPVSKLDIKPTLAYLLNGDEGFSLGTNMFASKDFICLNNERIVTDEYYFDERWYRRDTGEEVNMELITEEEREKLDRYYNYMKTELAISTSISINDLLE